MLRPVIMVVVIFRSYQLLREFDVVFTLTKGGPARATETLTYHIYARMFEAGQIGLSAAIAYLLFFITLANSRLPLHAIGARRPRVGRFNGNGFAFCSGLRFDNLARMSIAFIINLPLRIAVAFIDLLAEYLSHSNVAAGSDCLEARSRSPLASGGRERRRLGVVIGIDHCRWLGYVFALSPVFWIYFSSVKEPPDVFKIPPKWIFTPTTSQL